MADELLLPPMIIQPFVENAIVHAFPSPDAHGSIKVRFEVCGGELLCSITDDGTGFDVEAASTPSDGHKSLALEITRDRLKLMRQKYRTASIAAWLLGHAKRQWTMKKKLPKALFVSKKSCTFVLMREHRSIAASQHRSIAASQHRSIAASQHRSIAASQPIPMYLYVPIGMVSIVAHSYLIHNANVLKPTIAATACAGIRRMGFERPLPSNSKHGRGTRASRGGVATLSVVAQSAEVSIDSLGRKSPTSGGLCAAWCGSPNGHGGYSPVLKVGKMLNRETGQNS